MIDKYAGLATQIRDLERRLKEIDTKKASPSKVKEITDTIKNLKDMLVEKKQKKEDRKKKKEEAAKEAPKAEAATQPIEVVKESLTTPTEVTKESTVEKFAIDSKVEPIRGTPGSFGTVIREAGVNGDPLVYVKWHEGHLKEAHGEYGAYYPSDLRLKVEAKSPTDYVPREQLYNLESDLKSNYERSIADLQEEIKTATDKGEATWAHRLGEKLAEIQKAYDEKYNKTAEDENGSGGTNKLKVVDQNPAYDKDPQEKSTGYGGDRTYGWQTAPVRDDMTSLSSQASLKVADLDLDSIEKRWALYVDGKLAIRTLTRSKAERIAKERFPEQVASGKYEIKREDHVPVEAALDKEAINITVAEKLFVVNPLGKTAEDEYHYDVNLANGSKLFKITSKDEMGQEHLAYVIEKEILNHKEASSKCAICGQEFATYPEYADHKTNGHKPKMDPAKKQEIVDRVEKRTPAIIGKLTSNLAFLKKGSFVTILAEDKAKGQVKFASLDNSLRGWAPQSKFAVTNVPQTNLIDHEGHKDEVLADNGGKEILVTCPANSVNVEWRIIEAPPATPESLNPDVTAAKDCPDCKGNFVGAEGEKCPSCGRFSVESSLGKEARGCDQCEMLMINGVPCHETGCPNKRKEREQEQEDDESFWPHNASLNIQAHIRHEDGKWVIYSHDYKKKLGTYDTEEEAQKRLRQIEYFKHQGSLKPLSKKEANVMETKCEGCGKELGPEVFLSKWPVCGKCTKERHEKAVGRRKKADQDVSLADQVQGFKDRMSAVNERLANPPAKTADLETTQDLSNVDVKDLSSAILHTIDLLESKVGENVSADPELHPMLEDLENKVFEIEMKLGIKPNLPEHEKAEPEHKEIVEEVEKESAVEVKADDVNMPPQVLPPQGFRYAWDPKNRTWILVQITDAPGGGQ